MNRKVSPFGSTLEAIVYPLLLLIIMWLSYWADTLSSMDFYKYGVKPGDVSGLAGVICMPLIHAQRDFAHIVNNSLPIIVLLSAVIYFYREIALRVFVLSWLVSGLGLWAFAFTSNSYHIGMSALIYALAAFLFTSGVIRKYLPLQGISLFVVFIYGSMIWGIFPMQTHVSWQGHLSGMVVGILLALLYKNKGPQRPKYQYEIEKELGIEPPDLEAIWEENKRIAEEQERLRMEGPKIVYHYKENGDTTSDEGESDRQYYQFL